MISTAKLRYLRIAPRKVRLVTDMIRGKRATRAQTILQFTLKQAAVPVLKTLRSAIASAKNNSQIDESHLYISKITVDEGPKYKRFRARARGRAYPLQMKTSHVSIVLDEIPATERKPDAAVKTAALEGGASRVEKERTFRREKPRFRAEKEVARGQGGAGIKRMFRRKTV